jgi:putative salt-induced outer membrane protein YdiY
MPFERRQWSAVLVVLLASCVRAQDAAAPPAEVPPPPPPSWTGSGQVSFLRTSGNTETSVLGLGTELKYKGPSPWSAAVAAALNRGSVSGQENLKNLTASLRGGRAFGVKTVLFLQGAYTEDIYAGIDSRWEGELGLARKLTLTDPHQLAIEGGMGFAHEVRLPEKSIENFAFGRAGLNYKFIISKTADLRNEANYVANLKDTADWRFHNVAALSAALSARFSLKISHTLNRLNRPPLGKKKTDTTVAAALVAKF